MIGSVHDFVNLAGKFSRRRLANAARVVTSYHWSRMTGVPKIAGMPISISIEPTTSCNLRCPQCPSGLRSFTRPTGMLEPAFFRNVIDELCETVSYLTFYFQGEPYLNPEFLPMVRYAADKGIYTATSTNAHFLKDETARQTVASGLDRLVISIDGTTQESYESYRIGGSLDKAIEGAENVIRWKRKLGSRTPHVVLQFIVFAQNEHQVPEVFKLGKKIGADQVVLKTAQVYDHQHGNDLIPTNGRFARYKKQEDGAYAIKNNLADRCWRMWHSCVITWDGKVLPCCFDKDGTHVMGDLHSKSFREIWLGKVYQSFRQTLMHSRSEIEICKNCTEGTKVWA